MNKYKSYAKINLGLEVLGKRTDGFHEISTIISKINLYDEITLLSSDINSVHQEGINQENNIVFRILNFMTDKYKTKNKLSIKVLKNIPYSSGMGGGSSNAATTIEAVNQIFKLNLDSKEKFDIALKFGSDIPFFLSNSSANISGRGDIIKFIKNPSIKHIVIFHFKHEIYEKTKQIFNNNLKFTDGMKQKELLEKINSNEIIKGPLFNGLENSALGLFKNLKEIKYKLESLGIKDLSMSGAGPTYYSIQNSEENSNKVKSLVDSSGLDILAIKAQLL